MDTLASQPPTDTVAFPAAVPAPAGTFSLDGSWRTTLTEGNGRGAGLMFIRQTAGGFFANQGMFPPLSLMPSQIELAASVTGSDVTGAWSGFGGESGAFEWIVAPDGRSFAGRWRRSDAEGWTGHWSGVRT